MTEARQELLPFIGVGPAWTTSLADGTEVWLFGLKFSKTKIPIFSILVNGAAAKIVIKGLRLNFEAIQGPGVKLGKGFHTQVLAGKDVREAVYKLVGAALPHHKLKDEAVATNGWAVTEEALRKLMAEPDAVRSEGI